MRKHSLKIKRILLFIALAIIFSGYFSALFVQKTVSPNFSARVRAEGPIVMLDTNGVTIDSNYLNAQANIVSNEILTVRKNSPEVLKIKNYLAKRGSPMAEQAYTFVETAKRYGLPYNMMPAIAVIESNGGKYNYRPYNYAGMGGQGNAFVFENYTEAIETHARILYNGYYSKGAKTPEQIGKRYCYNCPTWGTKVSSVMKAIDQTEY
jgi:hypothetical protein